MEQNICYICGHMGTCRPYTLNWGYQRFTAVYWCNCGTEWTTFGNVLWTNTTQGWCPVGTLAVDMRVERQVRHG